MLRFKEAPWVFYLEIDEDTGDIKLRPDAPEDIRKKYEEYRKKQENDKSQYRAK